MSAEKYWAKSPADNETNGQSICEHTGAALIRLAQLKKRFPDLALICGEGRFWDMQSIAVLMHDLGKCNPGFQEKLRGKGSDRERHEVFSGVFLPFIINNNMFKDLSPSISAILTHHKDADEIMERYPPVDPQYDEDEDLLELHFQNYGIDFIKDGIDLFYENLLPLAKENGFNIDDYIISKSMEINNLTVKKAARACRNMLDLLTGAQRVIRSKPFNSKSNLLFRFTRGLMMIADHSSSAGEDFIFSNLIQSVDELHALFFSDHSPYSHQLESTRTDGSAFLTAPTGSGKTEAAVLWNAANSIKNSYSPSLFYILPFMASLNAMRARLGDVFGGKNVNLQHSKSLQSLYRMFLDRKYEPAEAVKFAKREKSLARLHITPVRITTPYQILKGAFGIKGHEAIMTDCAQSHLILDEIHAYEPKRMGMLLGLLEHLVKDLNCRVFIMSATLPLVLKGLFADYLGIKNSITATGELFTQFKRHRLYLKNGDLLSDAVSDMLSRIRNGENLLAVATTVARAQKLFDTLSPLLPPDVTMELLHGKFCPRDRFEKEQDLLRKVPASGNGNNEKQFVLIATQVVEVSLNVDFDVLYSDPAPLEALIQRFGRINRSRRHSEKDVIVMKSIPDGCPVYDEFILNCALDALSSYDNQIIDESKLQSAIDQIYSGAWGDSYCRSIVDYKTDFQKYVLSSLKPLGSDKKIEEKFDELFDGLEVLPESLTGEYETLLSSDPISAGSLFVPISLGQYHMLKQKDLIVKNENFLMARVPYTKASGLDLAHLHKLDM